jgi:hypothetical protein
MIFQRVKMAIRSNLSVKQFNVIKEKVMYKLFLRVSRLLCLCYCGWDAMARLLFLPSIKTSW